MTSDSVGALVGLNLQHQSNPLDIGFESGKYCNGQKKGFFDLEFDGFSPTVTPCYSLYCVHLMCSITVQYSMCSNWQATLNKAPAKVTVNVLIAAPHKFLMWFHAVSI